MEGLIVKYFDHQSLNEDSSFMHPSSFNEDKVYDQIIRSIKNKQEGANHRRTLLKIAASIILLSSLGILLYANRGSFSKSAGTLAMVEKEVGKGKISFLRLEDGTKVWLNAGSKLIYPAHFSQETREVALTGEAYFEVAHLEKKPFIIKSGAVKTVVLGTSFNINAYPDNKKVEVTVLSGKVAVITPGKWKLYTNTVYLTPNQSVVYHNNESEIPPSKVNAEESIDWKEGKLIFKSTPLLMAVKEFERKYNITLDCSDKIKDCRITADFNNESVGNALKVMTKMIDGTLSYQHGKYYLDGKGCN